MNVKEIVLKYRNSKQIKGIKPCLVTLQKNIGKIYTKGKRNFIMSIRDNKLYFQALSIFNTLKPELDFEINLNEFIEYKFEKCTRFLNMIYIYKKDRKFIQFFYNCGMPDTYLSEDNVARILDDFDKLGIKEIVLDAAFNK